jgi:D-amino-acid oxidase
MAFLSRATSKMAAPLNFAVLGAGVVGLSTSLSLRQTYPTANVMIIAKFFPGDKSIEYTSPAAGANWLSAATDSGKLEQFDRTTFLRFDELAKSTPSCGISRTGIRAFFDQDEQNSGILSQKTGEIWYKSLVRDIVPIPKSELPAGAVFGLDIESTFHINVPIYLSWYDPARKPF